MFEGNEELLSINVFRDEKLCYDYQCKFRDWVEEQYPTEPCELVLRQLPFDTVVRSWELRPFSAYERENMAGPMMRMRIEILGPFLNEAVATEFIPCQPPDDEELDYRMGLKAMYDAVHVVVPAVQSEYLSDVFDYLGWDVNGFIRDANVVGLDELTQNNLMESQLYRYNMLRMLEQGMHDVSPMQMPLYRTVYDELVAHLQKSFDAVTHAANTIQNKEMN
jgi:hypothetical protein